MHLFIQPARRIPELPCDLLEVGAGVEQILCVWVEDGEYSGFFHRDVHVYDRSYELC